MIGADGAPVLLDFGAARQAFVDRTQSLTALYTPGFAPIEQYSREGRHGASTDIYALAAVLYRCLTGRTPPDAPGRVSGDGLVPLAEAAPQAPSPAMQNAVHAALAVHARDRPQTLAEWRRMLAASPAATALSRAETAGRGAGQPGTDGAAGSPAARPAYADDLAGQRRRLVAWVRGQLVGPAHTGWFDQGAGPADPDEIRGSPVERFPIGVLHPIDPGGSGATGVDPAEPEADPDGRGPADEAPLPGGAELLAPLADDEDDESHEGDDAASRGETARPVGRRRYAPPSSVGVSFYVRGEARLRISASAASHRRVSDRGDSGRYLRRTPDSDAVGAEREPDSAGRLGEERGAGPAPTSAGGEARALEDAAPGGARYRRTAIEYGLLWPSGEGGTPTGVERDVRCRPYRGGEALTASFSQAETAGWKTQLDVRRRPYEDGHILTVVFANRQREVVPGTDRAHSRLFEARLACQLPLRGGAAASAAVSHRMAALSHRLADTGFELGRAPARPKLLAELFAGEWSARQRDAAVALARKQQWTDCLQTRVRLGPGDYELKVGRGGTEIVFPGETRAIETEVDRARFTILLAAAAIDLEREVAVIGMLEDGAATAPRGRRRSDRRRGGDRRAGG